MVTFVLIGQLSALGFIVVAKIVIRFGETRDDRAYAEYVLCGTLVSVSVALAIGLLLRWAVRMV